MLWIRRKDRVSFVQSNSIYCEGNIKISHTQHENLAAAAIFVIQNLSLIELIFHTCSFNNEEEKSQMKNFEHIRVVSQPFWKGGSQVTRLRVQKRPLLGCTVLQATGKKNRCGSRVTCVSPTYPSLKSERRVLRKEGFEEERDDELLRRERILEDLEGA